MSVGSILIFPHDTPHQGAGVGIYPKEMSSRPVGVKTNHITISRKSTDELAAQRCSY